MEAPTAQVLSWYHRRIKVFDIKRLLNTIRELHCILGNITSCVAV